MNQLESLYRTLLKHFKTKKKKKENGKEENRERDTHRSRWLLFRRCQRETIGHSYRSAIGDKNVSTLYLVDAFENVNECDDVFNRSAFDIQMTKE
jgi:hypothetical protein